MQLGTITITGQYPIEVDGLHMGYAKKQMRFKLTDKGIERAGKLYKTVDPHLLAHNFGVQNAKINMKGVV